MHCQRYALKQMFNYYYYSNTFDGTLSKAFSRSTKYIYNFLPLTAFPVFISFNACSVLSLYTKNNGPSYCVLHIIILMLLLLLLSTPLHQRAASRVQHPKSCGSQQSLPPGGKERLHFVGIRPEVQARKGGW